MTNSKRPKPKKIPGTLRLKFGVISDVHMYNDNTENTHWEKALRWFNRQRVDAVVLAGDIAQCALLPQFQYFAESWYRVFPNDTASDGRHVEKIFVYGNHDIDGWVFDLDRSDERKMLERYDNSITKDPAAAWKKYLREDYSPYYLKEVKGYKFLGLHWGEEARIAEALERYGAELRGDQPFFIVQHPHPLNTVYGPWAWGHDDGAASAVLAGYPNAVVLSGHSHYSLNMETGIWQDTFTSVGTGSLRYSTLPEGRENRDNCLPVSQMNNLDMNDSAQGMLFSVYDDRIVICRMDLRNEKPLASDWAVPLPVRLNKPYRIEPRITEFARDLPQFTAGAERNIAIAACDGKDNHGNSVKQIKVYFPTAKSADRPAFDYEVAACSENYGVITVLRSKRVYAPGAHLSAAEAMAVPSAVCVFAADELPAGAEVRFSVTPLDIFGHRGTAVYSRPYRNDK